MESPSYPTNGITRDHRVRVLAVDDEPIVLNVTSRMLEEAGYAVSIAPSAREALRLLGIGDPAVHLVLTDVVMPETDGRQLGQMIGQRHPAVPILYMSAYPEHDVLHRGSPGPGMPFLSKPFSAEALITAIERLLAKPVSQLR